MSGTHAASVQPISQIICLRLRKSQELFFPIISTYNPCSRLGKDLGVSLRFPNRGLNKLRKWASIADSLSTSHDHLQSIPISPLYVSRLFKNPLSAAGASVTLVVIMEEISQALGLGVCSAVHPEKAFKLVSEVLTSVTL